MSKLRIVLLFLLLTAASEYYAFKSRSTTKHVIYDGRGCYLHHYVINGQEVLRYNPLNVARWVERYFEERGPGWREKLIHCVGILEDHIVNRSGRLLIVYKFPWPKYRLPDNWSSCMSQSAGIVAFHYAYLVTGNETYKKISDGLLDAFFVEVERGGLAYNLSGHLWYEEYAHPNASIRPYVLNGFMYSLIELHKAYEIKRDQRLMEAFEKGFSALLIKITEFDTGDWTLYDLVGTEAPWKYHWVHIKLAEKLENITGEAKLGALAKRWRGYAWSLKGIFKWLDYEIYVVKKFYFVELPIFARVLVNAGIVSGMYFLCRKIREEDTTLIQP